MGKRCALASTHVYVKFYTHEHLPFSRSLFGLYMYISPPFGLAGGKEDMSSSEALFKSSRICGTDRAQLVTFTTFAM